MPELPEVETIRRSLEDKIVGKAIIKVQVKTPEIVSPDSKEFEHELVCQVIEKLDRRGKYLLICLKENKVFVVHFGMSGRLIYSQPNKERDKHTHVIITLDDGYHLRYMDTRTLGKDKQKYKLQVIDRNEIYSFLKDLGPEPLGEAFTKEVFEEKLRLRRGKIKPLLLDQKFIAGLGNIYSIEVLFRAKIHPASKANTLLDMPRKVELLYKSIREIICEAISKRGTNLGDGVYVDGNYQDKLRAYGREGLQCFNKCGSLMKSIKVYGRNSTFCPICQKL